MVAPTQVVGETTLKRIGEEAVRLAESALMVTEAGVRKAGLRTPILPVSERTIFLEVGTWTRS